jgi:eukaryotic-like serine/threonine-protein kinase
MIVSAKTPSVAETLDAAALGMAPGVMARAHSKPEHGASSVSEVRLLQSRVALYGKVSSILTVMALVLMAVAHTLSDIKPTGMSHVMHVCAIVACTAAWLSLRGAPRSSRTINAVDAGMTVAVAVCFALMAAEFPRFTRPDLTVTLSILLLTIGRAILVPSSPKRTLVLSALVWSPAYAVAYVAYAGPGRGILTDLGDHRTFAVESVGETLTWSVIGVTLATVASRVIYGLRREVREAQKLGQYTLLEKLGEGGMGQVFRAQHAMLRRPTAVKLLHPDRALGAEDLARFEREVQLTAQLSHPNVVTVFDYGRTPDGVFYYAMELLDGRNLEDVIEDTGPMPPARAIHVLAQVARALGDAHSVGLIHRDIKPANIILCARGSTRDVAKVVDFGLVKQLGAGADEIAHEPGGDALSSGVERVVDVSRTGTILGTPMYLAPEALRDPDSLDGRADLYALGAVAYFLLTGTAVFGGRTVVDACRHHLHTAPEPPSARLRSRKADVAALPDDLEAIVLQCLAKSPADRPQSAADLERALMSCSVAGTWTDADARKAWANATVPPPAPGERAPGVDSAAITKTQTSWTAKTIAVDFDTRERVEPREPPAA